MANFFISICNGLIKGLGSVLSLIFFALPPSPFSILDSTPIAEYLPGLNYFIPIKEMMDIGTAWLLCISVYYIYQIVLRWVKAID